MRREEKRVERGGGKRRKEYGRKKTDKNRMGGVEKEGKECTGSESGKHGCGLNRKRERAREVKR